MQLAYFTKLYRLFHFLTHGSARSPEAATNCDDDGDDGNGGAEPPASCIFYHIAGSGGVGQGSGGLDPGSGGVVPSSGGMGLGSVGLGPISGGVGQTSGGVGSRSSHPCVINHDRPFRDVAWARAWLCNRSFSKLTSASYLNDPSNCPAAADDSDPRSMQYNGEFGAEYGEGESSSAQLADELLSRAAVWIVGTVALSVVLGVTFILLIRTYADKLVLGLIILNVGFGMLTTGFFYADDWVLGLIVLNIGFLLLVLEAPFILLNGAYTDKLVLSLIILNVLLPSVLGFVSILNNLVVLSAILFAISLINVLLLARWSDELILMTQLVRLAGRGLHQNPGIIVATLTLHIGSEQVVYNTNRFDGDAEDCIDEYGESVSCCKWKMESWVWYFMATASVAEAWTGSIAAEVLTYTVGGTIVDCSYATTLKPSPSHSPRIDLEASASSPTQPTTSSYATSISPGHSHSYSPKIDHKERASSPTPTPNVGTTATLGYMGAANPELPPATNLITQVSYSGGIAIAQASTSQSSKTTQAPGSGGEATQAPNSGGGMTTLDPISGGGEETQATTSGGDMTSLDPNSGGGMTTLDPNSGGDMESLSARSTASPCHPLSRIRPQYRVTRFALLGLGSSFGSICFASAVLGPVLLLRSLVDLLVGQGRRCFFCCFMPQLKALQKLLEGFTKFTTIRMALGGESYLRAGRSVVEILSRNSLDAYAVWWMPAVVLTLAAVLASFCVAFTMGFLSYYSATSLVEFGPMISAVFIGVIAFAISMMVFPFFSSLLLDIIDAVFICYAMDKDLNLCTHREVHEVLKSLTGEERAPVEIEVQDMRHRGYAQVSSQEEIAREEVLR
eukprot:gene10067-7963_t